MFEAWWVFCLTRFDLMHGSTCLLLEGCSRTSVGFGRTSDSLVARFAAIQAQVVVQAMLAFFEDNLPFLGGLQRP